MKRLLPSPVLSLALLALWLLLSQSLGAGTLAMGVLLAVLVPRFTHSLRPTPVRMRRPGVALRLLVTVLRDMIRSNVAVARVLLTPGGRAANSGFVRIPLDLRDPNGLAVLSMIICACPGTAWGEIAFDRSTLLIHALEMGDRETLARHIKQHYERPLMEIFE
jgi:multicomponent K+:H+ antiporter subunit E